MGTLTQKKKKVGKNASKYSIADSASEQPYSEKPVVEEIPIELFQSKMDDPVPS